MQDALAIAIGAAMVVAAYVNSRHGDSWFQSKRGDLSSEERAHYAKAARIRRTQILYIFGGMILLIGIAAAFA